MIEQVGRVYAYMAVRTTRSQQPLTSFRNVPLDENRTLTIRWRALSATCIPIDYLDVFFLINMWFMWSGGGIDWDGSKNINGGSTKLIIGMPLSLSFSYSIPKWKWLWWENRVHELVEWSYSILQSNGAKWTSKYPVSTSNIFFEV